MRWSSIASSLLPLAALAESRSWQHVGKQAPRAALKDDNFVSHYLANRQTTGSKFLNDNTTSMENSKAIMMRRNLLTSS